MKKYFEYIKKDRLIFRLYIISFLFILITIIFIVLTYSKLPPLIPMYNQLPWGENRLSSTLGIFIPSIIVFGMFVANIALSGLSYSHSPLIARLISVTTFLIIILNSLFIFRTILLII